MTYKKCIGIKSMERTCTFSILTGFQYTSWNGKDNILGEENQFW